MQNVDQKIKYTKYRWHEWGQDKEYIDHVDAIKFIKSQNANFFYKFRKSYEILEPFHNHSAYNIICQVAECGQQISKDQWIATWSAVNKCLWTNELQYPHKHDK